MAMIRGVSWALASCTATSNAEQTKTTNVNIDEAKVANTARAASGLTVDSQPIAWSILWSAGTATMATTMPSEGRIQIEVVT